LILGVGFIALWNLPRGVTQSARTVSRESSAPLQGFFSSYTQRLRNSAKTVLNWQDLIEENQKMAGDIVELKSEIFALEELERENIILRQQLGFAQRSDLKLIAAEVIARDITGWWQTIRLNKGATHGITINQAVITEKGLVGRIVEVTHRTSDVLLISDPNCKVSCRLPRNDGFGILSGSGVSWLGKVYCKLDLINKSLSLEQRDELITSGLGGIFPKGILVGYVEDIKLDDSGLYKQATVLPAEDLSSLNYVFVVADADPVDAALQERHVGGATP